MTTLSGKFSKFLEAGKELAQGAVEAATTKFEEVAPVRHDQTIVGWYSINEAPQHIKDLAKGTQPVGEFRPMLDISDNPIRLYAFWATNGIVEAYYEIPRLR